jgi:hypothetical protein
MRIGHCSHLGQPLLISKPNSTKLSHPGLVRDSIPPSEIVQEQRLHITHHLCTDNRQRNVYLTHPAARTPEQSKPRPKVTASL